MKQGGVIGKGTSNSEFIRVYGKETIQHTHVEQQTPSGKKNIQDTLFPMQRQELKK